MGKLVEGLWDCESCGRKGNPGGKRVCESCGMRRNDNTVIYMPSTIKYVPKEEAKEINKNPDWMCNYCGCFNSDSDSICSACGSVRNSENLNYFETKANSKNERNGIDTVEQFKQETSTIASEVKENTDNETETEKQNQNEHAEKQGISDSEDNIKPKSTPQKAPGTIMNFVIKMLHGVQSFFCKTGKKMAIIISILALVVGLVYVFIPKNAEITIEQFSWERTISIERYQTVNESGWSLPDGARLNNTKKEVYAYENVVDHYETKMRRIPKKRLSGYEEYVSGYRDLGNGYYEEITSRRPVYETYYENEYYQSPVYRSEPIIKDKFYYEIDKWLFDRVLQTSGYDQNPYWEDISNLSSNERVSEKDEKYYISGVNQKGKKIEVSIPYDDWINLEKNQKVKLKVTTFGTGQISEN